jgi:hypothetical protein
MQRRRFQIVAQDPSVRTADGAVLTAEITLPTEDLIDGPMGYALYAVDYDASLAKMYMVAPPADSDVVPAPPTTELLLADSRYHAVNAYAIAMRTLLRFEFALGRRVGWGIRGHQLKIVPHAFETANAFYSPELEAVLFGYIRTEERTYLCLSHDIVAHETAHALLDGLRDQFMAPSSPDQGALHEAFADIVALLSVFSLPEIPRHLLSSMPDGENHPDAGSASGAALPEGFVRRSSVSRQRLEESALFGLAEQMRAGSGDVRFNALRRSVRITASPNLLRRAQFQEEHRRGEILVAAVMQTFLAAWEERIQALAADEDSPVNLRLVAEEGAAIADLMLTMVIRAIDYTPPIHITFGDFLSAMLTADTEVRADDSRYHIRDHLQEVMASFGILPASQTSDGLWGPPKENLEHGPAHLNALQTDPTEMFRLIWSNRDLLELNEHAHTRITSVRPCVRVSPEDGFQLRETVVECVQYLRLNVAELETHGLVAPDGIQPTDDTVLLQGGSTLILNEYGELKYSVANALPSPGARTRSETAAEWQNRLNYLGRNGFLSGGPDQSSRLAELHSMRTMTHPEDDTDAQVVQRCDRKAKEAWT